MGIRKADLKKFIQDKAKKRKNGIRETVRHAVEADIKPVIFEVYKEAEPIERQAQLFHDSLLQFIETNERFDNWNRKRIISDINSYVIGLRSDIVHNQSRLVVNNLLELGTDALIGEVQPVIDKMKKQLASKITEYRELVKLSDEITTIIDSCHNGDKAYTRLDELGVDLTGFTAANPNLPAIIKLSADVCVLNGNC